MTSLQRELKHKKKRTGILVPFIEEFMRSPVNIDDDRDLDFLEKLHRRLRMREKVRAEQKAVYSPSALGSCLRQVYLRRHFKELGIVYRRQLRPDPNFYFLTGNFLHLKWMFVLYKMEREINNPEIFEIIDFEVPIMSKWGDHGGTADVVARVQREPLILDFKGLNVRAYTQIVHGDVPMAYTIQLTDYLMLWNSQRKKPFRIERALLLTENKGGPDPRHPIALHETVIEMEDFKPEVHRRIQELRRHEKENIVPAPECVSVNSFQFTGCPFSGYCKEAVKEIQRAKALDTKEPEVAIPKRERDHRPRGNSRRQ